MALIIKGVSKQFEGTRNESLRDINLEVRDGEFLCIVGPSGCGKSTLLNLAAGLTTPTSGRILVDGKEVAGPGADRVLMFQESALFPWLTVSENVKFGLRLKRVPKKEQEIQAELYLKMVQLWDFRDYKVHEISGGMKQRTALARALTMDSRILLMDEPFSALDKQTINMLRKELSRIWEQTKKTILFVTHSVEEAVYLADRVAILSEHPGTIKEIKEINLPRPRRIDSEEFLNLRSEILAHVQKEVEQIVRMEYDQV